jgi:hypothetical protein
MQILRVMLQKLVEDKRSGAIGSDYTATTKIFDRNSA